MSAANRKLKLPSGAELEICLAPFADAKRLHQALLKELRGVSIGGKNELHDTLKNIVCTSFASPEVDAALAECLKRALYNGVKLDENTFEPAAARQDYEVVCFEVVVENVGPFMKSLYALSVPLLETLESIRA